MDLKDIGAFINTMKSRAPRGTSNDEVKRVLYEELNKLTPGDCDILAQYFMGTGAEWLAMMIITYTDIRVLGEEQAQQLAFDRSIASAVHAKHSNL